MLSRLVLKSSDLKKKKSTFWNDIVACVPPPPRTAQSRAFCGTGDYEYTSTKIKS